MSEDEYWCALKHDEYTHNRVEREIWLIAIPRSIRRGIKKEEILLTDLEKLRSVNVSNIALSQNYPPFQFGISMYNFMEGFPVNKNIKKFMIDALALNSKDLWDYKQLLEEPKNELTDAK